ncbi:MAG: primosomal protein N' [Candidatus Omnitrophota bacterium]
MYAKVLVNLPLEGPFDYSIPPLLLSEIAVGKRVWVSFGPRRTVGYVIEISEKSDFGKVKPVLSVIDREPIVTDELIRLTRQISDYYLCSWGEAIDAVVPTALKKGKVSIKPRLKEDEDKITRTDFLEPNIHQAQALKSISKAIDKGVFKAFLLYGVTGSGKTEVYLHAIARVLKKGLSAIVLVPEISLTPQSVERFRSRFGDTVALFHSRLTAGQKFVEWKKIKDGECKIVVGARSAILSPVKGLGLVIVDEEHDTSYKQQDVPRYNAVDVAIMRARLNNAQVIMGTATPSLESFYKAKEGDYELLSLRERINKKELPKVRVLDMRQEHMNQKRKRVIFSRLMREQIENRLVKGEQVILFLNRRGFSTYANCKKCGYVEKCTRCNVALNYHSDRKLLICHYCNFKKKLELLCPSCKTTYMDYYGFGTQRVESELNRYFPNAVIDRMDADSTKKRKSHKKILDDFKSGKTQIIIGTQMIAKGHDFTNVTLVGVVSADTALNLPDFRSGERTFQLLTQVSGRSGRGDLPGEVIIQSYVSEHYTINYAITHDYDSFYKEELALRKALNLPPFVNLINIGIRSYKEERAEEAANKLALYLQKAEIPGLVEIMGPAQAFIYRLRRQYRWNIMLKVDKLSNAADSLRIALKSFRKPSLAIVSVDVDAVITM